MSELLYVILPAIIAGIAVTISHAPLGQEVLKRGIIFIDLAIAQIAALGVIVARMYLYPICRVDHYAADNLTVIDHSHQILGVDIESLPISPEQFLAFIFAITAAYFFMFIEKKAKDVQEAVIGCSFVVATSLAMIIVANDPQGDGEIEAVLSGQILWASWKDIIAMSIVSLLATIIWMKSSEEKRQKLFYLLFAICVTFSVQLIGVYLVFASLIFPALATFKLKNKKIFWAYVISFTSYIVGIIASYQLDFPTSPTIILAFSIITMMLLFTQKPSIKNVHSEEGKEKSNAPYDN